MALDPDAPSADRPFYRRSGFWIGLGCVVPLIVGFVFAAIDAHGRQYAADLRARFPSGTFAPTTPRSVPAEVPAEENFCADPLIDSLFKSPSRSSAPIVKMVSRMDDVVQLCFRQDTWHGPDFPCSARSWGQLDPFTPPPRSSAKWDRWAALSRSLTSGATARPRTTEELARILEAEGGASWSGLEARLLLPHARVPTSVWLRRGGSNEESDVRHEYCSDLMSVIEARGQLALEGEDASTAFRCAGLLLRFAGALNDVGPGKSNALSGVRMDAQTRAASLVWLAARDRRWGEEEWRTLAGWTSAMDFRQAEADGFRWHIETYSRLFRQALADPGSRMQLLDGASSHSDRLLPIGWYAAGITHADLDTWAWVQARESVAPPAWPSNVPRTPSVESDPVARTLGYARISRQLLGDGRWLDRTASVAWRRTHVINSVIRTTSALERVFLRQGAYPPTLEALVPDFLPSVPFDFDGQPLRYTLEPRNGRYRIWSVAMNGADDGGREMRVEERERASYWNNWNTARHAWPTEQAADWVWQYP